MRPGSFNMLEIPAFSAYQYLVLVNSTASAEEKETLACMPPEARCCI